MYGRRQGTGEKIGRGMAEKGEKQQHWGDGTGGDKGKNQQLGNRIAGLGENYDWVVGRTGRQCRRTMDAMRWGQGRDM